jgi:dienelactone hydrolase
MKERSKKKLLWIRVPKAVWLLVGFAGVAIVWFCLTVLWPAVQDPVSFFEKRRSRGFSAQVDSTWHEGGLILQSLRIEGSRNADGSGPVVAFDAFSCRPDSISEHLPAFVLMGGIRTGRDAISLISLRPEIASMGIFLTLDYPYEGPKSFKGLQILPHISRIRRALFDGVEATRLSIDYLERQPGVDTQRIILLGGSVGAFYVVDAGAVDPRPAAVVAFMGGGRFVSLLDWNLRHGGHVSSRIVSAPLAWFTALLIRPLEPTRLVEHISPIPYIQVNATEDERIPETSAQALYDASRSPREMVWIPAMHVLPHRDEIIEQLMMVARRELSELGLLGP